MSKQFWIHAGLTVLGSVVLAVTPAVFHFAAQHSAWSAVILSAWTVLGAALNPKNGGSSQKVNP